MATTRRDYLEAYIEAAFSLGGLIAENPVLLREVENLVGNGFRGLDLPRGVRVRARSLITRIRKGETKPAVPGTVTSPTGPMTAVFETLPPVDGTEKTSAPVAACDTTAEPLEA